MPQLLIKNGLLIDPLRGESRGDLLLAGGRISRAGRRLKAPSGCAVFDAAGLWVFPGFIDVHVHAREPGAEEAETLESAALAAAAGGITSVLLMPNTYPPMARPALLRKYSARANGLPVNVYFSGAATAGRAGGKPSDLAALKRAGARAFTDDGSCLPGVALAGLLKKAAALGLPLLDHPEILKLTGAGVAAPAAARRLGLPAIPPEAEAFAVLRDILAAASYGPVHLQHLSLASSAAALRQAKKLGWPVTGETCPHYIFLSERDIKEDDADFKMKPPLRPESDRLALLRAVADGTIDIIASDHAPHERRLKAKGFALAPFGITGLETMAALCVTGLVLTKIISKLRLAQLLSANPARLLGLNNKGALSAGCDADLTIIDPRSSRRVPAEFTSRSSNSPFIGRALRCWPAATVVGGKIVYRGIC